MKLPRWLQWRSNQDLDEELQAHLDAEIQANIGRGLSAKEARYAALRTIGNPTRIKEDAREADPLFHFELLAKDFLHAFRNLRRNPGFTFAAVLSLAIGIGANTAIFSAVNTLLFHPPGITAPERLVVVRSRYTKFHLESLPSSFSDYQEVSASGAFSSVALAKSGEFTYTGGGTPQRLSTLGVTWRWFDLLGVQPAMGRIFSSDDDQRPAKQIAILPHTTWQRNFGGDPAIIGKTIQLDQRSYTVVGVLKPNYTATMDEMTGFGVLAKDVIIPMTVRDDPRSKYNETYLAVGRLAPGVSFSQASAKMKPLSERSCGIPKLDAYRKGNGWGLFVVPYNDYAGGPMKTPMLILWGSVGLVLLIASANIAGLTLARMSARARELAVRTALGGTRWHLARQLFAECGLLSFAGSVIGLGVAYLFIRGVELYAPEAVAGSLHIPFDLQMLAFTAGVGVVAALIFGLAPALQLGRAQQASILKDGGRSSTSGRDRQRLRSILVIGEVALALVLAIGAGLLLRSLSRLENIDTGIRAQGVMTASLALPEARYQNADRIVSFYRQLIDRLKTLPGASAVAFSYPLPFGPGYEGRGFEIEGRPVPANQPGMQASLRLITPEFFSSLGIPLLRGRTFTDQDAGSSSRVVIIDRTLADRFWPNEDPLGQTIVQNQTKSVVVGVVGHTIQKNETSSSDLGFFYYPLYQDPLAFGTLILRTPGNAESLAASMQGAVNEIDPAQPLYDAKTMQQRIDGTFSGPRFTVVLLALFAATSVFLAALGLYGVINYGVSQRTQEIGIRMALGAKRTQVIGLILGQGCKLAFIGLAAGALAAFQIAKMLPDQLFGVGAFDPFTFATTTILLATVALLASYVPARRASLVDPVITLREE